MAGETANLDVLQLVTQYHRVVYQYAYRLTGSVPDAEDLTQQVFLVAQEKLGQLRNTGSARSWLFTILRNYYLKTQREPQPISAASLRLDIDTLPGEIPAEDEIDRERLQAAIGELSAQFRIVLLMFYFEQRSYREIAEALDLPIGTVMSRLARAKAHLRSRLFDCRASRSRGQQPSTTP